MVSVLSQCGEGCGWFAAVLAALAWGTFGVPLKTNVNVEVNFFVMQTYKTIVCFLTSWLVILLGEEVRFTKWGIVSGIFWVPGAACGIYGIRNAGLAIAVGTWSSIIVVSSFLFGIIVFQEQVKDITQTIIAFSVLMVGLVGMSRYSEPNSSGTPSSGGSTGQTAYHMVSTSDISASGSSKDLTRRDSGSIFSGMSPSAKRKPSLVDDKKHDPLPITPPGLSNLPGSSHSISSVGNGPATMSTSSLTPMEIDTSSMTSATTSMLLDANDMTQPMLQSTDHKAFPKREHLIVLFNGRLTLTKRQMGVLGAVVNGAWGGLNLIPLHYAKRDEGLKGAGYLISYASGSLLVCGVIWMILIGYYRMQRGTWQDAIDALPSFHIRELGVPGLLAGLFYSVGNFSAILAVDFLGQGVGYSFCQAQLLVSGLWGVCYFREIQGQETVTKWFASAIVTIIGIIWLSYEHEGESAHR